MFIDLRTRHRQNQLQNMMQECSCLVGLCRFGLDRVWISQDFQHQSKTLSIADWPQQLFYHWISYQALIPHQAPGPTTSQVSTRSTRDSSPKKKLRSQQKSQEPRNHHILWNHQAHQHCPRVQLATHQRVLLAQQGTQKIPMYQDLPCQHGLLVVEWWKISGDGPQTCLWCGMGYMMKYIWVWNATYMPQNYMPHSYIWVWNMWNVSAIYPLISARTGP